MLQFLPIALIALGVALLAKDMRDDGKKPPKHGGRGRGRDHAGEPISDGREPDGAGGVTPLGPALRKGAKNAGLVVGDLGDSRGAEPRNNRRGKSDSASRHHPPGGVDDGTAAVGEATGGEPAQPQKGARRKKTKAPAQPAQAEVADDGA